MAPFKFPINDWDGNGSTDDLYDIFMERKVCESFETKEENDDVLSSLIKASGECDDFSSKSKLQSENFNNFPNKSSAENSNVWGIVFVIGVIMAIVGFIMNLD